MASPPAIKRLSQLIGPEIAAPDGGPIGATDSGGDIEVCGITADSRKVVPGIVFAAIPGTRVDGSAFAAEAEAKGAAAILAAEGAQLPPLGIPVLRSGDVRRALALMAARFYGQRPATTLAVTGTSGKTSVVEFTRQILALCGRSAASIGTLGVVKPDGAGYGSLTTPDPVALAATMAELADEGVTHVAFEASSHGLEQRRLDGVRLSAAAFTNLGRDHLDYHATVEEYLAAKLRLFDTLLDRGRPVVVNTEGARWQDIVEVARARGQLVMTVGPGGDTIRLDDVKRVGFQQLLKLDHCGRSFNVRLPLLGAYQVENALTAAGLALAAGEDPVNVFPALERLSGVPGRLEMIGEAKGGLAVVDYAHKPEALAAALDAVRPFASGRLICVVGCGGDRDKGKRPLMGAIAADKADVVIVTDDNPRFEQPAAIRAAILAAAKGAREIGDRREAIHAAISIMAGGDVVLVAGKGHERGQIIGDAVIPFSDQDEIRAALAEIG